MISQYRIRLHYLALSLSLIFSLLSGSIYARTFVSASKVGASMIVKTSDGEMIFSSYTMGSIQVEFVRSGVVNPPSYSLAPDLKKLDGVVMENSDNIQFTTGGVTASIQKEPFRVSYKLKEQLLFSEEVGFFSDSAKIGFRFNLADGEKLMGAGERVLGMDRRGKRLKLYNNASYGYETYSDQMYYSLPVVISSNKYMVVFDNGASGFVDLGSTEKSILQFEAVGGRTSYIVVAASEWSELTSNYTQLTGKQPMPPRWALGNISSRMGYHSQKEVENLIDIYRQKEIPLDGVVLDLYWFGKDLKGTLGNLEWFTDSFPDPKAMLDNNLSKGVNTILITEPFIIRDTKKFAEVIDQKLVCTNDKGEPYFYDFYFGNTTLLDIFKPQTKEWFWNIYKKNSQLGVAGWWGDLGEPEVHPLDINHVNGKGALLHNQYGHEWAKTLYEGYAVDFPNQRPVILMRSGFVGSQRYGMLPWSGDVSRSWGGLTSQVEITLQMGLQGLGYMSSDLGGFAGTYKDAELYTRWLQYGVFQPVFRTHGQEEVPAEPVFWDDNTIQLAKQAINLRYSLTPYLYTLAYENSILGLPLMRPIFFYDKEASIDIKDQYYWGSSLIVAPIVEKGQLSKSVYLPKGRWYDFVTKTRYEGGGIVNVSVAKDHIPVFVKAGSFIPMVPVVQTMQKYSTEKLFVNYYHDETVTAGSGYIFEDDGASKNSIKEKAFETISFASHNNEDELAITITPSGGVYVGKPEVRTIELYIHKLGLQPSKLVLSGEKVKIQAMNGSFDNTTHGAFWNSETNTLCVKFQLRNAPLSISVIKSE